MFFPFLAAFRLHGQQMKRQRTNCKFLTLLQFVSLRYDIFDLVKKDMINTNVVHSISKVRRQKLSTVSCLPVLANKASNMAEVVS
jgi:hypothetical protein